MSPLPSSANSQRPVREIAQIFPAAGEQLLGIAALPDTPRDCGVVLVVGGPQYRVGSHRQFLLLSRHLAAAGFPVFRFDYRGMGDGGGEKRDFTGVSEDIGAAIEAFQALCPDVRRFVLWGLCDAASAILMYVQATRDARVAGVVALNPWVRSETSLAQTHIKHYYGQRLMQREFWAKLLTGRLHLFDSLRGLLANATRAYGTNSSEAEQTGSFQDRMAEGLRHFRGEVLLILSGQDYTAREFLEYCGANPAWRGLLEADKVRRVDIPEADHTFSSAVLRARVEEETLTWLVRISGCAGDGA